MRFDQDRFAAFDLHILQRPEASAEYSEAAQARAKQVFAAMTQADIDYLVTNIASALPGSTTDPLTIPQFRDRLLQYQGITTAVLRQHLIEKTVARVALLIQDFPLAPARIHQQSQVGRIGKEPPFAAAEGATLAAFGRAMPAKAERKPCSLKIASSAS